MNRLLTILLLFVLACTIVQAQWRTAEPIRLNTDDGLISLWAKLMQDSVGHIYLGTDRGMYRYDGSEFQFFGHDADDSTTIGAGPVHAIHESSDGLIYIGLGQDVLQSYNRRDGTFKRYTIPANNKGKYTISSIFEDNDGVLWLGSNEGRLIRFNHKRDSMQIFNAQIPKRENARNRQDIQQIFQDKFDQNILWFYVLDYDAVDSPIPWYGFLSFNKQTNTFGRVPCGGQLGFQDKQGNLWAGFQKKVVKYSPSTQACQTTAINDGSWGIMDLMPNNNGMLLITKNGIYQLDTALQLKLVYQLQNSDHAHLYQDKSDRLWLSDSKGLSIYDENKYRIDYYSLSQFDFDNRIYPGRLAYDEVKEIIYLAPGGFSNDYKKIFAIPLNKKQTVQEFDLPFAPSGICFDRNQNLIISGGNTLSSFDSNLHKSNKRKLTNNDIPWLWNLQRTESGWIGGAGNRDFYWFHEEQQTVRHASIDSLMSDVNNASFHLLAGCTLLEDKAYLFSDVIYEVDLISGKCSRLYFKNSFNTHSDPLLDVEVDHNGNLWVASIDALELFELQENELVSLERYTSNEIGFKAGTVELHLSRNQLWLFGYFGLYGFDLNSLESRFFGLSDGLGDKILDPRQIIEVNNNKIATINGNGLVIFHPDSLWNSKNNSTVKTIIKKIRIDGKTYQDKLNPNFIRNITIPVKTKIIDIQFQALAFPTDDGVSYSYRLLGQQDDWVDINENKYVSFTSLTPGRYIFQVKASSAVAHAPIKSITFDLPTPFLSRWYVILICALLVITLLYSFIHQHFNSINKREKEENERKRHLMEIELKALRSQMNPHFMFNTLNSIKSYILQSQPAIAAEYLSDFAHLVRMILQHSRENLISLEEEMETLTLYIELEKMRLENEFTFSCKVADDIDLSSIQLPPLLLQPFVENAIWHGLKEKGNGHLGIELNQSNTHIFCIIEDNGIGRRASQSRQKAESKKYRSLGMGITQERVRLINYMENLQLNIDVVDLYDSENQPKGTRVVISFKNELK